MAPFLAAALAAVLPYVAAQSDAEGSVQGGMGQEIPAQNTIQGPRGTGRAGAANAFMDGLGRERFTPTVQREVGVQLKNTHKKVGEELATDFKDKFPKDKNPGKFDIWFGANRHGADLPAPIDTPDPIGGGGSATPNGSLGGIGNAVAATLPRPELGVNRDYIENSLVENPSDPRLNFALAVHEQESGNHRAADMRFATAIAGGQDDARTLTFASLSALNAGDPRKAAAWATQALEKDPGGPLSEQAEAISKMALKRLPKEEDPFGKRPPTRSREDAPSRADSDIPELDRPLPPREVGPSIPPEARAIFAETNRLVSLASKAYRGNDIKEALKLSNESLAQDPDDVRALQVRAAANAKEGNWEEARKDADRGLDLAPGYVPLLLLRAAAAAHAKDWRAVKADAQSVLAKEKTNATAWRFKGIAEAGLGARSDAVASLSRATQYGDHESARLLSTLRSLPPGADVVDLVEMLSGAAASREAATDARSGPAPAPIRSNKTLLVLGAAIVAGLIAGGLILLAGRRDSESA